MPTIVTPSIRKKYKELIKQVIEDLHKPIFVFLEPEKEDCPNCFMAGTLVETPTGVKNIEDFSPGDIVYDGCGVPREVSKVFYRHGKFEFSSIRCHGNSIGIEATSNHKLSVFKNEGTLYCPVPGERVEKEIGAIRAGDIVRRAVITLPVKGLTHFSFQWKANKYGPKKILEEDIPITDDFLFSYGLYLAEGCTSKGRQVQFCLNTSELEEGHRVSSYWKDLLNLTYSVCGRSGSDKNAVFELYSAHLADFFDKNCGQGAYNKFICDGLYYKLDKQQTLTLLKGLYFGDGHQEQEYRHSFTTVSKKLAYQVQSLLISCGFSASILTAPPKIGAGGVNRRRSYTVRYWEEEGFELRGTKRDQEFLYMVVKETSKQVRHADVFNLEVSTEHSYIADGFSVHNCVYDFVNKRSSGRFESTFTASTTIFGNAIDPQPFQRGRCPVCYGEGHLEQEVRRNVKALVKWNPRGTRHDLEILPVGREGKASVRIKVARADLELVTTANSFLIDGVRCELIQPPTIRGLGTQEELVVAFLMEVETGKVDINK